MSKIMLKSQFIIEKDQELFHVWSNSDIKLVVKFYWKSCYKETLQNYNKTLCHSTTNMAKHKNTKPQLQKLTMQKYLTSASHTTIYIITHYYSASHNCIGSTQYNIAVRIRKSVPSQTPVIYEVMESAVQKIRALFYGGRKGGLCILRVFHNLAINVSWCYTIWDFQPWTRYF